MIQQSSPAVLRPQMSPNFNWKQSTPPAGSLEARGFRSIHLYIYIYTFLLWKDPVAYGLKSSKKTCFTFKFGPSHPAKLFLPRDSLGLAKKHPTKHFIVCPSHFPLSFRDQTISKAACPLPLPFSCNKSTSISRHVCIYMYVVICTEYMYVYIYII